MLKLLLSRTLAFVLSFLFWSGHSFAQVQIQLPASRAEALLTEDLMKAIAPMSKEVRLYNYFNLPQMYEELKTPQGRTAFTDRYVQSVMGRFWDLNYVTDTFINAGPGLYAAIDPSISSNFGNTVLEITVAPGERVLNVVRAIPVRQQTADALIAEGIVNASSIEILLKRKGVLSFSRDTLKNVTTLSYIPFRRLIQTILQKNQVGIIEYNWDTHLSGFCRRHSYSAFVFVGKVSSLSQTPIAYDYSKKLLVSNSVVFPNLTPDELKAKDRTASYRAMLEDIKRRRDSGQKIPLELPGYYFANSYDLQDIVNKTYSCVK